MNNSRPEFIHIALQSEHLLWACWMFRAECSMIFWFFCCCPSEQQASVWSSGFFGRQWGKAARCVLFICLLRSGTHAGLFISPQQVCACADHLTCCFPFRVLFPIPVSWNSSFWKTMGTFCWFSWMSWVVEGRHNIQYPKQILNEHCLSSLKLSLLATLKKGWILILAQSQETYLEACKSTYLWLSCTKPKLHPNR